MSRATADTPAHDSWAVTVYRNGERVVTLACTHLAGRDLSESDARIIRLAATHLLAFIGPEEGPAFIGPEDGPA